MISSEKMEGGKLKLAELNPHLICVLCGGYLIDATSIVECLHSFCRTCIVHYLHTSNYCPVCEVLVHKKRPLEHIRPDTTLQNIVYKVVPDLFREEMKRRREFYETMETEEAGNSENIPIDGSRLIFNGDEMISMCLQFWRPVADENSSYNKFEDNRFLLCPAGISICHLKKFIRSKFSLPDHSGIDVFCKDEILDDTFTLVDVAYLSGWKRDSVLQLTYAFYGNPAKRQRLSVSDTTQIPVASDDTCSNGCVSSVTNIGSDDECFEDSGCEVNDSQISYDESALSDIVDQQENCCGIDLSMKTMRRNSTEGNPPLRHNTKTDKCQMLKPRDTSTISYMTSYVSFLGQRVSSSTSSPSSSTPSHVPMKLPLRSPTPISTPPDAVSMCALNDSGHVDDNDVITSTSVPTVQNNNYVIMANNTNVEDKPLTLKIRKPSCDLDSTKSDSIDTDSSCDRHTKCVGVCNGHVVKSKSDKLLLRLSRDGDSNTYTASMS